MALHESGQMYLEAIYVLTQKNTNIRSIDVGAYLGYSKPSVSRAIGILKGDEYITVDADGYISLTEKGKLFAIQLYERHTVLSNMLMALGVDEQTIISDYLLSNEYARDKIKPLRKHRFLIAASKNYDDLTMVAEGVIPIGAISAINSVKERYGTIEAYLEKEMNMSLQDIETMRNTYLE
jgi:DNA-binding MarR family transcriptional regulator